MLKQLQAVSGTVFFMFLIVHLFNTSLAVFGSGVYDGVQSALRTAYQFAPIEALLLAALAVHIVVGLMRIFSEPKRDLTQRAKWHRYAGFFLVLVIFGHIAAVRGSSWFFDVYPQFEGLAFSIDYLPGYFYPYYFLLGLAGFYHGLNGISIAGPRLGINLTMASPALKWSSVAFATILVAALLGLGGLLFDVGDPRSSAFAKLALELIGTGGR